MTYALAALLFITPFAAAQAPTVTPLKRAHAHNDYEHARPLLDALDQGFCSVEADVFSTKDGLLVAHTVFDLKPARTLQKLYLDPLRERARANDGTIHKGEPTFYLLIDVKTDAKETYPALAKVLAEYDDILTVTKDGKTTKKAVTAIISGNCDRAAIAADKVRYAAIDGRPKDLDGSESADLIPWVSESWKSLFKWKGDGPMPEAERKLMRDHVAKAHAQNRLVRFWGTPDGPAAWGEQRDAGVDLINTDRLAELRKFLTAPEKWSAGEPIYDPRFILRNVSPSSDGKRFAVEDGKMTVVFDAARREKLFEVKGRFARFVGNDLITWMNSGVQYDGQTGKLKRKLPAPESAVDWVRAQISPDGTSIAGFDGENVRVIDVASGAECVMLAGQGKPVDVLDTYPAHDVVWSQDGKKIAGVYRADPVSGVGGIGIWDAATGALLARREKAAGESGELISIAFSPDGSKLAVAGISSGDHSGSDVELLDAKTLKPIRKTTIRSRDGGADLTAVAFSPDGGTIAVALNLQSGKSPYIRARLLDAETMDIRHELMSYAYEVLITSLAFTPDGRSLITATGLVETPGGRLLRVRVFNREESPRPGILIWKGEGKE